MATDRYNPAQSEAMARQQFDTARNLLQQSGAIDFLTQAAAALGEGFEARPATDFLEAGVIPSITFLGPPAAVTEKWFDGTIMRRRGVNVVVFPFADGKVVIREASEGESTYKKDGEERVMYSQAYGGHNYIKSKQASDRQYVAMRIVGAMKSANVIPEDRQEAFDKFRAEQGVSDQDILQRATNQPTAPK